MKKKQSLGFTLTELMITVAIIGILASMAAPSFQEQIQAGRVKGAAEVFFGTLQNLKSEVVKTNTPMDIVFTPSGINTEHTTWCYGVVSSPGTETCDCTASNCIAGSVVKSSDYTGISVNFTASNIRSFSPLRGTGSPGTVTFSAGNNKTVGVKTSNVGRILVCKPSGSTVSTNSGDC